jgi:hypothetical protein
MSNPQTMTDVNRVSGAISSLLQTQRSEVFPRIDAEVCFA